MKRITYTKLLNRTLEIYMKGDYLEAYNFITENYKGIKGNLTQIYNFRYSIANEAGLEELALQNTSFNKQFTKLNSFSLIFSILELNT
ncbi:unnamed protein product, partial [marine sediment metagenome]